MPGNYLTQPSTAASTPDPKPVSAFKHYSSGAAFSDPLLWQIAAGLGLASGALGGAYEYMAPDDPDETPSQRRMRALRSALVSGGAGALVGLGGKATYDLLSDGSPRPKPGILASALGLANSPVGYGALGAGAGSLWDRRGRFNTEANMKQREYLRNSVAERMNTGAQKASGGLVSDWQQRLRPELDPATGKVTHGNWEGKHLDSKSLADKFRAVTDEELDSATRSKLRFYGMLDNASRPATKWTDRLYRTGRHAGGLTGALVGSLAPYLFNAATGGE